MDFNVLATAFVASLRPHIEAVVKDMINLHVATQQAVQASSDTSALTADDVKHMIDKRIKEMLDGGNSEFTDAVDGVIDSWVDMHSARFEPDHDDIRETVRDILSNATIEV